MSPAAPTVGTAEPRASPPRDRNSRSRSIARWTRPESSGIYRSAMSRIRKHVLDGFLVLLAAAEVASVLAGSAAHKPAAAALSAISVLVFLGRRWQPLAASVAAFASLTVLNAVMPRATLP